MRQIFTYLLILGLAWTAIGQKRVSVVAVKKETVDRVCFIIQKNDVYGLGDSAHFFADMPTGDSIFHLGDWHFGVRNNNRFTLINDIGIPLYKNALSLTEFGEFILLQDSTGEKVFSKKFSFFTRSYDSIKVFQSFAILYDQNKQGIVKDDWSFEELIEPLYDKVGPYYGGVLLINNGKLGWIGEVNIPVDYDHIYKEQAGIIAAENTNGTVYYSLRSKLKLQGEPSDSIVFYDYFYKRVRGVAQTIFRLDSNQFVTESSQYELHPFDFDFGGKREMYAIAIKDKKCAVFKNGKPLTEFIYDNVLEAIDIEAPYFRVVQNGRVGVINEIGEFQLTTKYTDIIDKKDDYYIFRQGNKVGIVKKNDTVVLPAQYTTIYFESDKSYAYFSQDGRYLGMYDYENKKELVSAKYDDIDVAGPFVLARKSNKYDVYCENEIKFNELVDVQTNNMTVKGYKDGRIYMGYVRNERWEDYNYEIPSYKVVSTQHRYYPPFRNHTYKNEVDMYDYSVGKWGRYSYLQGVWTDQPLVHSGNAGEGERLLSFRSDSLLFWTGISFYVRNTLSPMQIAWDKESKYCWLDSRPFSYSKDDADNSHLRLSPLCYRIPGKGRFLNFYTSKNVNAVFTSGTYKSVFTDNGKLELSKDGDLTLSEYMSTLSSNGNIHPAAVADYGKLIDPSVFVKITGGIDHVLHTVSRDQKHHSIQSEFEGVNKKSMRLIICVKNNKYGIVGDSGNFILKPFYESIEPVSSYYSPHYKVGVKSHHYKVYDPVEKTFSRSFSNLLNSKDDLLLSVLRDSTYVVLNLRLDTLHKSKGRIVLLGGADFSEMQAGKIKLYRRNNLLFSSEAVAAEKINETHFLLHTFNENTVVDANGSFIFKTKGGIKHYDLGSNYLLDDGKIRSIFNKENKLVYTFEKSRYLINEKNNLIIKEENSVSVFNKNEAQKVTVPGKFSKAGNNYLIVKDNKYKHVYAFDGQLLLSKATQIKELDEALLGYKSGKHFFVFNLITKTKKKVKKRNLNMENDEILDEDFNDTSLVQKEETKQQYYLTQNRHLYGLRNKNEVLLKNEYHFLQRLSDHYLVQDGVEYKLFNSITGRFEDESSYQVIYPYRGVYMVMKDGVISYIK